MLQIFSVILQNLHNISLSWSHKVLNWQGVLFVVCLAAKLTILLFTGHFMHTSLIRSVYIYSSFYPPTPHPPFPLYNRCMWCLSLDVIFIRGRSVLPLAGCAAAVPFNWTAWFLARLGIDIYFNAAALIHSPVGSMVIKNTELWGHMWITIKRKFVCFLTCTYKCPSCPLIYCTSHQFLPVICS